jgi:FkbM family methyltransferase
MLPLAIRKLSCNPRLRQFGHRLHVNHFVKQVYCRLLSTSGLLPVSCLGVHADFKSSNSRQLAFVDYILTSEKTTIEAALCSLKPGDTFLDVGSHYGIFSVLASKLVGPHGRVIAVEPHPESLAVLRENLALNGCGNVEILNAAFSDTSGPIAMVYDENFATVQRASSPNSTVPNPQGHTGQEHTAQGLAGDEALRHRPVPAAMKIDVEGHEYAVLSGLKRTLSNPSCRRLCLEIHPPLLPPDVGKDEVLSLVRACGLNVVSEHARSADIHVVASR